MTETEILCSGSVYRGFGTDYDPEVNHYMRSPIELTPHNTVAFKDELAVSEMGKMTLYSIIYFTDDYILAYGYIYVGISLPIY